MGCWRGRGAEGRGWACAQAEDSWAGEGERGGYSTTDQDAEVSSLVVISCPSVAGRYNKSAVDPPTPPRSGMPPVWAILYLGCCSRKCVEFCLGSLYGKLPCNGLSIQIF